MSQFVFKDYKLADNWLVKTNLIENKHLLWQAGGVPAIDSKVWDGLKKQLNGIKIWTNKNRNFMIDKETFENNKKELNYGTFGKQYFVEKKFWKITDVKI